MMHTNILIIGGGNMGGAIARALAADTRYTVAVVEHDKNKRMALAAVGLATFECLSEATPADITILAVKPQQFAALRDELSRMKLPLLVSIMAGIPLAELQASGVQVVRSMPNLPAAIGESMTVLCAPDLSEALRSAVTQLFEAIGRVAWVEDEEALHAVTAISGSGPAYLFAFMEALQTAATAHGLSPALARELVTQTMKGAALLASQSTDDAALLRAQVTSKAGTTEAALAAFAQGDLTGLVKAAVEAACRRSQELMAK